MIESLTRKCKPWMSVTVGLAWYGGTLRATIACAACQNDGSD